MFFYHITVRVCTEVIDICMLPRPPAESRRLKTKSSKGTEKKMEFIKDMSIKSYNLLNCLTSVFFYFLKYPLIIMMISITYFHFVWPLTKFTNSIFTRTSLIHTVLLYHEKSCIIFIVQKWCLFCTYSK